MITVIMIVLIILLIVTVLNMFMLSAIVAQMAKWDNVINKTLERIDLYFSDDDE